MIHDFDPVLWHIYGDIGIRWYGLSYILGFIAAYLVISWLGDRQKAGLTSEMVSDLITYLALGTIIGGRLGYVFFYSPELLTKFKPEIPYWGVLAVNEGGMASHGGMIGIVIAAWLFVRKSGINFTYLLDLCAVGGPLGVFFGRIANFINGELVGRPAPADLPWAVKFPTDLYLWPKRMPERLEGLGTVVEKINVEQLKKESGIDLSSIDINPTQWLDSVHNMRNDMMANQHVLSTLDAIVKQIQHGNTALRDALGPFLVARHPSQLYAAFFEGLFLFLILFFLWRKPRRPGFIAGCFLIFYAIFRISDEYFRMPDDHLGFQIFGLTRGQLLSIAMLIIGLIFSFVWARSSAFIVQGWGRVQSIKIGRK